LSSADPSACFFSPPICNLSFRTWALSPVFLRRARLSRTRTITTGTAVSAFSLLYEPLSVGYGRPFRSQPWYRESKGGFCLLLWPQEYPSFRTPPHFPIGFFEEVVTSKPLAAFFFQFSPTVGLLLLFAPFPRNKSLAFEFSTQPTFLGALKRSRPLASHF